MADTKICIIDVDIGINIDEMISEDIIQLTGNSRNQLDGAIETAKEVQRVKTEKDQASKNATDKTDKTLQSIYSKLLDSKNDGISANDVAVEISGVITTMSAFTLKMKKFLSDNGNKFILEKKKIDGTVKYILTPYN